MGSNLDTAINAVSAAEATWNADVANVANIEASITQAQTPLAPAQATLATDTQAYVAALNAVVTAAQEQIKALAPPPPTV
jgi:hypothetical protein